MDGNKSEVSVERAKPEHKELFENLYQLYSYDLSVYFPEYKSDNNCIWKSPTLHEYFPSSYWRGNVLFNNVVPPRFPFLITYKKEVAGFALIKLRDWKMGKDQVLHSNVFYVDEFFVLKNMRSLGLGSVAANLLFKKFPGKWALTVLNQNYTALRFWHSVIKEVTDDIYTNREWTNCHGSWTILEWEI